MKIKSLIISIAITVLLNVILLFLLKKNTIDMTLIIISGIVLVVVYEISSRIEK
ncbi:hypothetical protein GCM10009118_25360 [Wandonia haliotis]|uniref:Uncharacterized protein n=1 Tax=Wandonia haliotis TaxID=574963 RepID=A0ABP3Y6Q9_9FLAO